MVDISEHFAGFDDEKVKASTGTPDPIPAGDYALMVESFEIGATRDGTGALLKAVYSVASGEFEGQKVFANFNIRNKNTQTQTIAIGEFKALCLAADVPYEIARQDTDPLINMMFRAKIGFDKENIDKSTGHPYPPRNVIKKYYPQGAAEPPKAAAKPAAAAAKTVAPAVAAEPPKAAAKPAAAAAKTVAPAVAAAATAAKPQGDLPWAK